MPHLPAHHPIIPGLRCVLCRSDDLSADSDTLRCGFCGQDYPVVGGVPVMFEQVSVQSASTHASVSDDAAGQVLAAFGLPGDAISLLRVRRMLRTDVAFGGALVQAESQQFLDRLRNSGHHISASGQAEPAPETCSGQVSANRSDSAPAQSEMRDLATIPRYGWTKNYLPRRIAAGTEILANIRLENRGAVTLHSAGTGHAMVALRWHHPDGTDAAAPDARTPLPIDLNPGQALTVAVRVASPLQQGPYRVTITLVQEQVRWLDQDAITLPVTVVAAMPGPVPEGWRMQADAPPNYEADHARGRAILCDWLAQHAPQHPRVLEIGGNAVPMLGYLTDRLGPDPVNVDVDLIGLQIGRMMSHTRKIPVKYLCADAFNLPFGADHFDAIVIFASLHHFPDPAALLEHLARKLRPGGFIGLFCEPVGHIWPGAVPPPFLAELERGVNEQSFSLREYELMFAQAELIAADVVVDVQSLKARLIRKSSMIQPA
jgi:SAM-dependent methyltransferase/uncharacterized protein YbaR (Trm112 family)